MVIKACAFPLSYELIKVMVSILKVVAPRITSVAIPHLLKIT